MQRRKIRDVVFRQPDADKVITSPGSPPKDGATVRDKTIGGGTWRRARIEHSPIFSSIFINADLTATTFDSVTLDTCLLDGCALEKLHLNGAILKDVIFQGCQLDGMIFTNVRTVGPVAFVDCSLNGTIFQQSKLGQAIFQRCSLIGANFVHSDLQGCDVRENDLSQLAGITSLRGLVITRRQIAALAQVMTHELKLRIEDLPATTDQPGTGYC